MTIPAVSRRNIASKLAATVWMSSARTTRGLAISSKTPTRERTVKPIVRPALPRGGAHDADVRGVESGAGQSRSLRPFRPVVRVPRDARSPRTR
jgi:hypothetical protein